MDYMLLTLIIIFASVFIHIFLSSTSNRRKSKLPPGPHPLPVIGNLLEVGSQPHRSLFKLSKIYGPLITLKLGKITTIVVSSSDSAKQIFQHNDLSFSSRTIPDSVSGLNHSANSMVWLPVSDRWRSLRKICALQMFTTQRLDAGQSLRMEKIQELVNYVKESCESGEAVDIGRAAFTTSLNLISNSFFSMDLANHHSSSSQEFMDLVFGMMEEIGRPNIADYFPALRFFDPQGVRRGVENYFKKLFKLFDNIIDQRKQSPSSTPKNDFLEALLNLTEQPDHDLSCNDIKHLLLDLFLAGTDTSSSTVEWAMAELLRNPTKLTKAQIELQQVIGKDKSVQESDISKLPFLQAIVKETFRLHPAAAFLVPHKANTEVEINGFSVPKDAAIWVNVWGIGRDSTIWDDPESFLPERFLDCKIDFKGHDFELIPFGAGRRICPGLSLGHRMVHLMLVSLLHSFDWKLEAGMKPEDVDMGDKFGLTLHKAVPLRAIPVRL